ncbi:response regulator [Qipengyuania sediminis]|uniref:response regulator n=1 Tax=Qipengyuania sediminis TaxID=1532023 RepID=UPI00105A15C7|nr:response regulator [Qipengyuania sediminis]
MSRVPDMEPHGPRARVLIVDDDERNLLALSEVLTPIADVVCSPSGRDALRQLLRDEFAVILLDVFMPDLDGYETAAIIRQREQTARIPIIFLSAVNKETEHLMRGYEMGAVDYVFKPVDPVVLRSKVSVFVDLFSTHRRLEESERRQASILRALPMAIYEVTERDGELLRQFRGGDLTHFLGDQAGAVERGERQWHDWVHPEDRPRLSQEPERGGDSVTVEYRWIGPQGARHHILDQRIATGSGSGPRRWAGSLLDITERKELEARLVHAGKLDALGQLTGGVAHDFNNLLAAMLGGISILERRLVMGERERVVIDQMRHAATQGTELVRRMMAFARQQDLTPDSVDPATLCDSVAGLVDHTLGGKVQVEWECPQGAMNLFVDRGQLELALMNLIINARDAMPDGGTIKVAIVAEESKGSRQPMIRLSVSDSGTGIPEDVLERVTEPFFTTKEAGKGTGLGLSMVAGFAHQSGGEIRIDSAVGRGTTIDLILPATEAAPAGAAAPAGGQQGLDWLKGKRVMLIDDDEAVRTVLTEQFRDAGGIVTDYASGDAAVAAAEAKAEAFDYILSDFAMPGLDGLATLRRLATLTPGARTALMTGNADDARLGDCADTTVVRKPLNAEALARIFA